MAAWAFVLHLTRATARRDNARTLVETCGLPGELWPAVDGAALGTGEVVERVGTHLFAPSYPFALRPGEIGCFLSHREIWAEIVRRSLSRALVIEDDVTLDAGTFARALALGLRHVGALGYVQLQDRPPRGPARAIDREGPCALTLPRVAPLRTSAQLVSLDAARRLLAASHRIDRPVDSYIQAHWHTGLRPAAIWPSGVSTIAGALAGSTIQGGRKPLAERLWREGARLLYRRRVAQCSARSDAPDPGVGQ